MRLRATCKDVAFSMESFYLALSHEEQSRSARACVWKLKIPPRIAVFGPSREDSHDG